MTARGQTGPVRRTEKGGRRYPERGDIRVETLIEIATLYYYEDVTQEQLSQRFSISRATISRLLQRARAEGLVEIRVHQPSPVGAELERGFIERFGIARLFVSATIAIRMRNAMRSRGLSPGIWKKRCRRARPSRSEWDATSRRWPTRSSSRRMAA